MRHPGRSSPVRRCLAAVLTMVLAPCGAGAQGTDGVWSPLLPESRSYHSAIYDPVRDRMLVCGGYLTSGAANAMVWELSLGDASAWRAVPTSGETPPPFSLHSAIYDPVGDRMVVFGSSSGGYGSHDVWTLSLSGTPTWTHLTPQGSQPPDRYSALAVYDPIRHRMVIFGGLHAAPNQPYATLDDVWALSLGATPTWTSIVPPGMGPTPRYYHHKGGIYDPLNDRMIVFGGNTLSSIYLNDLWALNLSSVPAAWTQLSPPGPPPERTFHSAVYDAAHARMLVFGGRRGSGPLNDVWALSLEGSPEWQLLAPGGTAPGPRGGHSAVYDPQRMRMIVWGESSTGDLDAWSLSVAGAPTWTPLEPASFPPRRSSAVTIHDPVRDRVVHFGGRTAQSPGRANDAWILPLGNLDGWSALAPSGTPPSGRIGSAGVYDPARDRMLIFGGSTAVPDDEVWSLALSPAAQWSVLSTRGPTPSPRSGHSLVYDARRDRLLLYGGANLDDLWSLSLDETPSVWRKLAPGSPTPAPGASHTAFYDEARDRMLVFLRLADSIEVWELSPSPTPAWRRLAPLGTAPPARDHHTTVFNAARDRVLLFGGVDVSDPPNPVYIPFDDVWAFDLAGDGAWSRPAVSGDPAPRTWAHGAVYDAARDRMVVIGGLTGARADYLTVTAELRFHGLTSIPPGDASIALALGVRPNPAPGPFDVWLTLPTREPARLELLDISGRRVASREVGSLEPGRHRVTIARPGLPAGIYLLRLAQGPRTVSAKVAVIR